MKKNITVGFVIACTCTALLFLMVSASVKIGRLQTKIEIAEFDNREIRSAFQALTKTNWVFKDAQMAVPGYYTVTIASLGAGNLEIQTLDFTVPAKAFSIYLRNMDRYGEPRALKGKPVTFRLPQGPPYGEHLVFNGLLEFAVIN